MNSDASASVMICVPSDTSPDTVFAISRFGVPVMTTSPLTDCPRTTPWTLVTLMSPEIVLVSTAIVGALALLALVSLLDLLGSRSQFGLLFGDGVFGTSYLIGAR